jgi:hypothetical protein
MSQDVAGKMLKPDFDMEVSGLVYGFLFVKGISRCKSPPSKYAPACWTAKMISSGCISISTTQPPRSG